LIFRRRQRLYAVGDAGFGGRVGDRREAFGRVLAPLFLPALFELTLRRRAVHDNRGAEVGG
jgi:hypothetical protein